MKLLNSRQKILLVPIVVSTYSLRALTSKSSPAPSA